MIPNARKFQPGQSGNPGGRPKTRRITEALLLEMNERAGEGGGKGLRKVASQVWELAEAGERWAVEFIRDTLDGKPSQAVEIGGDPDRPLVQEIRRVIVHPGRP